MLSKLKHLGSLSQRLSLTSTKCLSTTKAQVAKEEKASIRGLENEPEGPIVKTQVPGPKSKKLIGELSKIQVGLERDCL